LGGRDLRPARFWRLSKVEEKKEVGKGADKHKVKNRAAVLERNWEGSCSRKPLSFDKKRTAKV